VLAATDPANPFGATLPWPKRDEESEPLRGRPSRPLAPGRRPSRVPGAYVVTLDAEPVLYVERGGKGLLSLAELEGDRLREALEALAEAVRRGRVPRLGVERFDGEPVVGSPAGELLVELGFRQGPRRLTLSA
jgi:ATP-dependent helicase Lhr and Lhr-like helicase